MALDPNKHYVVHGSFAFDEAVTKDDYDSDSESLNTRLTAIETKNNTQDSNINNLTSRMSSVESKNTTQDTRLSSVESKNTTQDSRLTAVENKNNTQDATINQLYYKSGDTINSTSNQFFPVVLTSSGERLMFYIPLSKPIIGKSIGSSVTLNSLKTEGLRISTGGYVYLYDKTVGGAGQWHAFGPTNAYDFLEKENGEYRWLINVGTSYSATVNNDGITILLNLKLPARDSNIDALPNNSILNLSTKYSVTI